MENLDNRYEFLNGNNYEDEYKKLMRYSNIESKQSIWLDNYKETSAGSGKMESGYFEDKSYLLFKNVVKLNIYRIIYNLPECDLIDVKILDIPDNGSEKDRNFESIFIRLKGNSNTSEKIDTSETDVELSETEFYPRNINLQNLKIMIKMKNVSGSNYTEYENKYIEMYPKNTIRIKEDANSISSNRSLFSIKIQLSMLNSKN